MRIAILLSACLLPACLLLAACAGPSITGEGPQSRQITSLYGYGAAGRDLKLEVQGNGFPKQMSGAAFAKLVEAGVQGPLPRALTHPTLTPDASARDNYRLVFLFNPAPTMGGQDLCDNHADQEAPVPGELHLVAAFCVAGRAETEVTAWTPIRGPEDPALTELLHQVMLSLFRPDHRDSVHSAYPSS